MPRSKNQPILPIGEYHYSLREIGGVLGLSAETIRKEEHNALEKCKRMLEARGLTSTCLDDDPGPGPHLYNILDVVV